MPEQDASNPGQPQADAAAKALSAAQEALAKAKAANAPTAGEAQAAVQAAAAAADGARGAGQAPGSPAPFAMPNFGAPAGQGVPGAINLLDDVALNVKIELGRTHMLVEDVLSLAEGSVVELDKLAGDPVDVYVNDRRVARGEVLVLNDNFCVRINEIVADTDGPKG